MRDLQIDELAAFRQVVDSGSLSAAARELGTSVSSVSRKLARLEARLEVRLIERSTRRLSVTDEGRVLYAGAGRVLDDLEALGESVHADRAVRGEVRLVVPTLLTHLTFEALPTFLDDNPQLALEWLPTDRPSAAVGTGYDIVVQVGHPGDTALIARRLGVISGRLAAAPSYVARHGRPARLTELADHLCLRFRGERQQTTWELVDRYGELHRPRVTGTFESPSSDVLYAALLAGAGIGVLGEPLLEREIERGRLVAVLPTYHMVDFELYALYPPTRRRVKRVRVVLDWLAAQLG